MKQDLYINKGVSSKLFRRTPGYFEHRCDSYKKQVSVPVQTFFLYTKGSFEAIRE